MLLELSSLGSFLSVTPEKRPDDELWWSFGVIFGENTAFPLCFLSNPYLLLFGQTLRKYKGNTVILLKNKVLMTKYHDMASGNSMRAKYWSDLLSVQISWKKKEIEAILAA